MEKRELDDLIKEDQKRDDIMITHVECKLKDGSVKNSTPDELNSQQDSIQSYQKLWIWNEGKLGKKVKLLG